MRTSNPSRCRYCHVAWLSAGARRRSRCGAPAACADDSPVASGRCERSVAGTFSTRSRRALHVSAPAVDDRGSALSVRRFRRRPAARVDARPQGRAARRLCAVLHGSRATETCADCPKRAGPSTRSSTASLQALWRQPRHLRPAKRRRRPATPAAALKLYAPLATNKLTVSDEVLDRIGRTALAVGEKRQAAEAYVRLYYEFPLTAAGAAAAAQLDALKDQITRTRLRRRHRPRADPVRRPPLRRGEERRSRGSDRPSVATQRELADLRIAECDFYLKNYAAARDGVAPYLQKSSRLAEARFFYLSAAPRARRSRAIHRAARALVAEFPDSSWAEETLNNLGTHYILTNDDEAAAATFREHVRAAFRTGQHAERAAWKYGWWSYKTGDHAETIRVFEARPRPSRGRTTGRPISTGRARAHAKNGAAPSGIARMRLVYRRLRQFLLRPARRRPSAARRHAAAA